MKQITLIILTGMIAFKVSAQDNNIPPENKTKKKDHVRLDRGPAIYITTSTGINNNTGIVGFNFELPVNERVAIDAGPGFGTWAYKVYAGAKYYLKPAQRGFAFGAGFTYAVGEHRMRHLETSIYGNTTESIYQQNPRTNVLFAAYRYWSLGEQYNRLYAQLGWSIPLSGGDKITQISGPRMSENSIRRRESLAPGGPILAIGISFGVH